MFASTTKPGCGKVVSGLVQFAADQALFAIVAHLDQVFGVPAGIVANHGDDGCSCPYRGVEFAEMEPSRPVPHQGDDRRFRARQFRSDGVTNAAADRTGWTINNPGRRRHHRLRPLPKLAPVGDEDRIVRGVEGPLHTLAQCPGRHLIARRRESSVAIRHGVRDIFSPTGTRLAAVGNFKQLPRRISRVGTQCQCEPSAQTTPCPLDSVTVGVDDNKAAIDIDRGRFGKAQCEINCLAKTDKQIGLRQHFSEGAQ